MTSRFFSPSRLRRTWPGITILTAVVGLVGLAPNRGRADGAPDLPPLQAALNHVPAEGTLTWEEATPGVDYITNELIVGFDPESFSVHAGVPATLSIEQVRQLHGEVKTAAAALARQRGYQVIDTSPVIPVALMRLPAGKSPLQAMADLRGDPRLAFVEPNGLGHTNSTRPKTDPCWDTEAAPADPCLGAQNDQFGLVGLERGWDALPSDFTVRIAVIDSGFHFEHPDKWFDVSQTEDFDFVTQGLSQSYCPPPSIPMPHNLDLTPYDDDAFQFMDLITEDGEPPFAAPCMREPNRRGSHGTIVAGVIASAWDNGLGGVGAIGRLHQAGSGTVTLIPIQVIDSKGSGTLFDASQGILYAGGFPASNGRGGIVFMPRADIANISLAWPTFSNLLRSAVVFADGNGLLIVAASGNALPGNIGTVAPNYPAWFPEVVSVSALDPTTEVLATFSHFGKVDLTAPGVNVYTTAYDFGGCQVAWALPCNAATGGVPTYGPASGTSVAAPIVAAVAALYKAADDTLTNTQIKNMLFANAADWGSPGRDTKYGAGLVQAKPGGPGAELVSSLGAKTAYMVDARTGVVRSAPVALPAGTFQFTNLPVGDYYLFTAADRDGDLIFGETGEGVGASGGGGLQGAQSLPLSGTYNGNLVNAPLGWPDAESEPGNSDSWNAPSAIFPGLYAQATYSSAGDVDWFHFRAPRDGAYRIWTEGRNTIACREDLGDMVPGIELYNDPPAVPLADGVLTAGTSCQQIVVRLTQGQPYLIKVESVGTAPQNGFATILRVDRVGP